MNVHFLNLFLSHGGIVQHTNLLCSNFEKTLPNGRGSFTVGANGQLGKAWESIGVSGEWDMVYHYELVYASLVDYT